MTNNRLNCAPKLSRLPLDYNYDSLNCTYWEGICQAQFEACSQCVSVSKAFLQCITSDSGCGDDVCDNVAPVAPSPRSPVSPAAANACQSERSEYYACVTKNGGCEFDGPLPDPTSSQIATTLPC
jgi:hypothetical protein